MVHPGAGCFISPFPPSKSSRAQPGPAQLCLEPAGDMQQSSSTFCLWLMLSEPKHSHGTSISITFISTEPPPYSQLFSLIIPSVFNPRQTQTKQPKQRSHLPKAVTFYIGYSQLQLAEKQHEELGTPLQHWERSSPHCLSPACPFPPAERALSSAADSVC